jgi:hypothetical protein
MYVCMHVCMHACMYVCMYVCCIIIIKISTLFITHQHTSTPLSCQPPRSPHFVTFPPSSLHALAPMNTTSSTLHVSRHPSRHTRHWFVVAAVCRGHSGRVTWINKSTKYSGNTFFLPRMSWIHKTWGNSCDHWCRTNATRALGPAHAQRDTLSIGEVVRAGWNGAVYEDPKCPAKITILDSRCRFCQLFPE